MYLHKSWLKWLHELQQKHGVDKGRELFKDFCYILGNILRFHYDEVEFDFNINEMKVYYNINRDEDELIDLDEVILQTLKKTEPRPIIQLESIHTDSISEK